MYSVGNYELAHLIACTFQVPSTIYLITSKAVEILLYFLPTLNLFNHRNAQYNFPPRELGVAALLH